MSDNEIKWSDAQVILEIIELKERVTLVQRNIDELKALLHDQKCELWIFVKPSFFMLTSLMIEKHVINERLNTLQKQE